MLRNYILCEVINKETNERCKKNGHRVGRECVIDDNHVKIGKPLLVMYEGRLRGFYTSNVVSIEETDYGVWIETENSLYRFDDKYKLD